LQVGARSGIARLGDLGPASAAFFRVGALAALGTAAIAAVQIVVFAVSPPPSFQPTAPAVSAIFELLRASPVLGLVELDVLMLVDYVLILVVFVALLVALRGARPVPAFLGTVLGIAAIAAYLSINPALSMLALSRQYPGDGIVAAGQAVLANFQGSAFIVHYLLMGVAGMLISFAMLRSDIFSRATAVTGLVQGAMMLVPSTFGTVGLVFALGSLAPFIVWFVLIAARLWGLAGESASSAQRSHQPASPAA
jgi:hypothetical protein